MATINELVSTALPKEVAHVFAFDMDYNLTAAGTGQSDAYAITKVLNIVGTTAASTGVRLPATRNGDGLSRVMVVIKNNGANTLSIYPATGESINAGAANAPKTIATLGSVILRTIGDGEWIG